MKRAIIIISGLVLLFGFGIIHSPNQKLVYIGCAAIGIASLVLAYFVWRKPPSTFSDEKQSSQEE